MKSEYFDRNSISEMQIGEIVAKDIKFADVFLKHKIDFCCKGNKSLKEVTTNKNLDIEQIKNEIFAMLDNCKNNDENLSMSQIIEVIVKKHHTFVRENSQEINTLLVKLVKVHGDTHPYLRQVKDMFLESTVELEHHMFKEENLLFPYIIELENALLSEKPITPPFFGTVLNPIERMREEHSIEGDRFEEISKITNNFTPPSDACNTFKLTYYKLNEFVNDLYHHIHLENNILFKQALESEQIIFQRNNLISLKN